MLSQEGHSIAFFSNKMAPRMQAKSAYVREMYAISEAVVKFRHYLYGHQFIIHTDHKSLRHLTDQTVQTPEQEEWLYKLFGFRYSIEYKPGKSNMAADALSRSFAVAHSVPHSTLFVQLQKATRDDEELQQLITQCSTTNMAEYSTKDGLLF